MFDDLYLKIFNFLHAKHSKESISVSFKAIVLKHISFERSRCK